ncbi:MAG: DnaJ domain-containing protein [Thermoplasmatota archaeon]
MKDRTSQGIALHIIGSFMLVALSGLLAVESLTEFSGMSCFSVLIMLTIGVFGINSLLGGNIVLLLSARKSGNLFLTVLAAVLYVLSPVVLIGGVFVPYPVGAVIISLGLFSALVSLPLPHLRFGGRWPAVIAMILAGIATLYVMIWIIFLTVSVFMPILFMLLASYFLLNGIASILSYISYRRIMRDRPIDDSLFPDGMGILSPKSPSSMGAVKKEVRPAPPPPRKAKKDEDVRFPFTEVPGMEPFAFKREPPPAEARQPAKAAPLSSGFRVIAAETDETEKPREEPIGREEKRKRTVYYRKPPSIEDLFRDLDIPEGPRKSGPGPDSGEDREKDEEEARVLADDIDLDLDDVFIDGEDLYEILRIPRFSNQQAVRKAYRKRAMMYHPDLNPGIGPEYAKMIEEEMRKINLAKEVLLSADRKDLYDSVLRQVD